MFGKKQRKIQFLSQELQDAYDGHRRDIERMQRDLQKEKDKSGELTSRLIELEDELRQAQRRPRTYSVEKWDGCRVSVVADNVNENADSLILYLEGKKVGKFRGYRSWTFAEEDGE